MVLSRDMTWVDNEFNTIQPGHLPIKSFGEVSFLP